MATPFITALLASFAEDPVLSLERRDPPTHAVARAVYRDGTEVVVAYELIDAPPPPVHVTFGGELSEASETRPLFPMMVELSLSENLRRWRVHVVGSIRRLGRHPRAPDAAEAPPELAAFLTGAQPVAAFERRAAAKPPEPPPPPSFEPSDEPSRWRRDAVEDPVVPETEAPDTSPDTSPSAPPAGTDFDAPGGLSRPPGPPRPSRPAPSRPAPPPPSRPSTRRSAPPTSPQLETSPSQAGSPPSSGASGRRPSGSTPAPPAPPPPPPVFEPGATASQTMPPERTAPQGALSPAPLGSRDIGSRPPPPAPPPPTPIYGDDEV